MWNRAIRIWVFESREVVIVRVGLLLMVSKIVGGEWLQSIIHVMHLAIIMRRNETYRSSASPSPAKMPACHNLINLSLEPFTTRRCRGQGLPLSNPRPAMDD